MRCLVMLITAVCILFLTIDWLNVAVSGRFFTFLGENLLTPNTVKPVLSGHQRGMVK